MPGAPPNARPVPLADLGLGLKGDPIPLPGIAPPALDQSLASISAALDNAFGTTRGSILYRGAASWLELVPGTSGNFLKTLGAGADPAWAAVPAGVTGANPTATASDTAVNGVAATFLRSDGAPAVQKCSSTVFGLCKVDNTTITQVGGVISAAGSGSGYSRGTPPSVVQSAFAVNGGNSITFGVAPTNGNLLVAIGFNPTSPAAGAGWTAQTSNSAGVDFGIILFKVAGAAESATQSPLSGVGGTGAIVAWELSGANGTSPLLLAFTQNGFTGRNNNPILIPNCKDVLGLSAVGAVTAFVAGANAGTQDVSSTGGSRSLFAGHTDLSLTPVCGVVTVYSSGTNDSKSATVLVRK